MLAWLEIGSALGRYDLRKVVGMEPKTGGESTPICGNSDSGCLTDSLPKPRCLAQLIANPDFNLTSGLLNPLTSSMEPPQNHSTQMTTAQANHESEITAAGPIAARFNSARANWRTNRPLRETRQVHLGNQHVNQT